MGTLAVLALFASCKQRGFNNAGTKSAAGVAAPAAKEGWFNQNYTHENGGVMLLLNYSGESSIQFAGRSPWAFVGKLEMDGSARLSGILRQKVEEGTKPCHQFRISTTSDGSAYPNGMVKVTWEWDEDMTSSFKASCQQMPDFTFASKSVSGMFKLDNPPASAWFNKEYTHENGGVMLLLNYSGESSIQFAGRSPWAFVGKLEMDGSARLSGILRQKVEEGTKPCHQFRISTTSDGSAYANGMVKVTWEWDEDMTSSFKASCQQMPDFMFASKSVSGMYKISR